MRYLMFTYANLMFPAVKGLQFKFALESNYPTDTPIFYGTFDDDASVSFRGVIGEINESQFNLDYEREMYARKKVPEEVTAAQGKSALFDAGLYLKVEEIVKNHPYPRIRIWWESAQGWRRDNIYIQAVAVELDLSEDQVDQLFISAKKIIE